VRGTDGWARHHYGEHRGEPQLEPAGTEQDGYTDLSVTAG
jgi:hypothetical protein